METSNYDPCAKLLKEQGFDPVAPYDVCDAARTPFTHRFCADKPPYYPVQIFACARSVGGSIVEWKAFPPDQVLSGCSHLHQQDPQWNLVSAYCCCSGGGPETRTPQGAARVEELPPGGQVMAGSFVPGSRRPQVAWDVARVGFSAGVELPGEAELLRLRLQGAPRPLLVPEDQVFVRAGGALAVAAALRPGDRLLGSDGGGVAVLAVDRVRVRGALHRLATDRPWTGTPDGHLLELNGVVAGDFVLQLHLPELDTGAGAVR